MIIDDEKPAVVDCPPVADDAVPAAPIKNGINDMEISFLKLIKFDKMPVITG